MEKNMGTRADEILSEEALRRLKESVAPPRYYRNRVFSKLIQEEVECSRVLEDTTEGVINE
jgi:hypothetical protein